MNGAGSTIRFAALVVAVMTGGLMAGAFLVSPLASELPWVQPATLALAAAAVMYALVSWLKPARVAMPFPSLAAAGATATPATASRTSHTPHTPRTPNAVQALAARGTNAIEIARQTRMPIDAVSLLLAVSAGSRQLQPPAA